MLIWWTWSITKWRNAGLWDHCVQLALSGFDMSYSALGQGLYSSRPGSARDFTHVRLIFMNDSFIKCVSSILKYWRNIVITEENETINQPHSVVHPGLCCGHYIHQIAWSIRFVEVTKLLCWLNKTLINTRWLLFRRLSINAKWVTKITRKKQ